MESEVDTMSCCVNIISQVFIGGNAFGEIAGPCGGAISYPFYAGYEPKPGCLHPRELANADGSSEIQRVNGFHYWTNGRKCVKMLKKFYI